MDYNIKDLNAKLIYDCLDRNEGKGKVNDGKLEASIWNQFINETGLGYGNKSLIKYSINKEKTSNSYGALVSLSSYLKKADNTTKQKVINFLEKIDSDKSQTNTKSNEFGKIVTSPQNKVNTEKQVANSQKTPAVIIKTTDFSDKTQGLMKKDIPVNTHLLKIAQENLGLKEVTYSEFQKMSPEEKQKTQYAMIGCHGSITDAWCAHTVSTLCKKAGINIGGHYAAVQQFIDWGRGRNSYKPINYRQMTNSNYITERESRAAEIKNQFSSMQEGDFIIMKNQYIADTDNEGCVSRKASHIMIVEKVDVKSGIITVIEGNANENVYQNSKKLLVTNKNEGLNGNQTIGEFQEKNKRDGLIRKQYTPVELASAGYSGYIDNSKLVS